MFQNLYGLIFLYLFIQYIAIIAIIFVSKYAKKQREEFGKHIPHFILGSIIIYIFLL